jgi:hypothetical protein
MLKGFCVRFIQEALLSNCETKPFSSLVTRLRTIEHAYNTDNENLE